MELMDMTKKKVWMAGTVVLILLAICTILSLRVEKLMRIEVEVVKPGQSEEEKLVEEARIPLSCYQKEEYSSTFFYLEEREGLFGKEMVAVKTQNWPLREDGETAVIVDSQGKDMNGNWLQIVSESVYPLEDGDVIEIGITEHPCRKMMEQNKILIVLVAMIPLGVILFVKSVKMIGALQDGDKKKGMQGIILIAVWLGILYYLTGLLDIPREYLPPEQILDIGFYLKKY